LFASLMVFAFLASVATYRKLWQSGQRREIAVSAVVLSAGVVLAIIRMNGHHITSPMVVLSKVFHPASRLLSQFLS